MAENKVLKFNHSKVVTEKNKRKKTEKVDEGFNEMTKELRNRLITKNKELMKEKPKVEHSMTSEINNFDNAIKFLERKREKKKKKEKRKHRNTVKCHTKDFTPIQQQQQQTTGGIKSEPPCGVLKNGKKPLWRDYHKTRKKKLTIQSEESPQGVEIQDITIGTPVVEETPAVVVEETPADVVEETPPVVLEEKPMVVVEETPAAVVEEKPMVVVEEKPAVVVEEKPKISKTKIFLGKVKSKLHFLLKTRKRKKKSNRYTQKNVLKTAGLISSSTNAPDDVIQTMYDSIVNDDNVTICKVCDKENKE